MPAQCTEHLLNELVWCGQLVSLLPKETGTSMYGSKYDTELAQISQFLE